MSAGGAPSSSAAIWSAVAAWFAALSSLLIMLTQRRNLLESTRPQLVLLGWTRRGDSAPEALGLSAPEALGLGAIKNVGKGVAVHVEVEAFEGELLRPKALMPSTFLPLLAPDEEQQLNAEVTMFWQNVADSDPRVLPIALRLRCFDCRNVRHETRYTMVVTQPPQEVGGGTTVAPGVVLLSRTTGTCAGWRIRLAARIARLPLVGRPFRRALRE